MTSDREAAKKLLRLFQKDGIKLPDEKQLKDFVLDITGPLSSSETGHEGDADLSHRNFGDVFSYPWQAVSIEETEQICSRLDPVYGKYIIDAKTTEILYSHLPWYENVRLLRLKDPDWAPDSLYIYFLHNTEKDEYHGLNGTSPPIHEVNENAPVLLNKDNVLGYLRFFCFFVRGEEGPFLVAEGPDDPLVPKGDASYRKIMQNILRPATFEGMDDDGKFLCDATIYYSNAVFIANFAVQPGGMCEMLDDEPLEADLALRVVAPVA